MPQKLTVFEIGQVMAQGACVPDRTLVNTLGMTPSIAWGVMKDRFAQAFDREPISQDETEFTKGFRLGLLENQKQEAEQAIQELDQ